MYLSWVSGEFLFTRPVMESVSSFGAWGVSLRRPVLETVWSFVGWGVSLTCPVLKSVSSIRRVGSLSYTPYTGNCLISRRVDSLCVDAPVLNSVWSFVGWGVSLTRPVLIVRLIFICPVWLWLGSLSYTPRAGICSSS